MTREEAKYSLIFTGPECDNVYEVIDKIYDDFESRTCENCKYLSIRSRKQDNYCIEGHTGKIGVRLDGFGCNKHEPKDD